MSKITIINDSWEKAIAGVNADEKKSEQMKIAFFAGASTLLKLLPILREESESAEQFMDMIVAMENECAEFDKASREAEAERLAAAGQPEKKKKPHLKIIK